MRSNRRCASRGAPFLTARNLGLRAWDDRSPFDEAQGVLSLS
ncbi:MAG: hypothetical protein ACRD09_05185 [Vicinamibacterales bacterium]